MKHRVLPAGSRAGLASLCSSGNLAGLQLPVHLGHTDVAPGDAVAGFPSEMSTCSSPVLRFELVMM